MRRNFKCLIFKRDSKYQLHLRREHGASNKEAQQKDNQQTTRKHQSQLRSKNQCPLNINCLQNNIVYQSIAQSAGNEEKYTQE